MSTILNTNGDQLKVPTLLNPDSKFVIITAEWNSEVTHALRDGAEATLIEAGLAKENIIKISVPGTVELVNIAAATLHGGATDGIIVIGCVIRGDTPHFDYVCMHTTEGIARLNAEGETAVTFGVLTVENLQQALDRAGGCLGNKGSEAAVAAIEMANLHTKHDFGIFLS